MKSHKFAAFVAPVSNRYSHHLVDWARTQSTTRHRRRALNSRRARKKSGGRWAAAGPAAVGRLAGPPRARTSRPPNNTHQPQSKRRTHSVHEPQREPLSFRKSSFSRAHLSAAAILCDRFLSLSSKFSKFRVSCRFRFVSKISESDENRPHCKTSNFRSFAFPLISCRFCFASQISGSDENRPHSITV